MASEETVNRIRDQAVKATSVPIDSLVRNPAWGSIDFESARPDLAIVFSLAGHLRDLPIELVVESHANAILQSIGHVVEQLNQIKSFTIEQGNARSTRDTIVQELRNRTESLLANVQGWVGFLAYQKGDVQQNIASLNKAVDSAGEVLSNAKTAAEARKRELDGIISAAREASAKVGVAHFTEDFAGQATKFENEAKSWLTATAFLAGTSVLASLIFYLVPVPAGATTPQLIQQLSSKLVFLGVLITSTVWCARIYRGTRHQAATNNHRAQALKSFQAFVKATDDEATKNAVLLETTRSIFALAPSGFLDGSDSSSDGASKVLEIVKGASKAS